MGALTVMLLLVAMLWSSRHFSRLRRRLDTLSRQRPVDQINLVNRLVDVSNTVRRIRERDFPRVLVDTRDARTRIVEDQREQFKSLTKHVARQGRRDYEQQLSWQQLRDMLRPERYMPALRGWAASPDVLCLLVEAIRAHRPRLVVECGSGASSVWLGLALRRFDGGRLIALEHDERYAQLSRELVAAHGLSDVVEIRHAPLCEWRAADADAARLCYDVNAVADLSDIDLLFVDGPSQDTGPHARYPAGPVLLPRCSDRAVVVIDDADRRDESAATKRWLQFHPDFPRSTFDTEKGTHVLDRASADRA